MNIIYITHNISIDDTVRKKSMLGNLKHSESEGNATIHWL